MMRRFLRPESVFNSGLAIKLVAIFLLVPVIQKNWFVPFVQHTLAHPSFDPWNAFLLQGGDFSAFPYGLVMLIIHGPFVAFGQWADWLLNTGTYFAGAGFGVSLLAVDYTLLWALKKVVEAKDTTALLLAYWCSPIVFFITYWHGQTDIVPVTLMVLGLVALKENRLQWCGACLGLSIAAKLSSAIVLPFIAIVLIRNARYHPHWRAFVLGLAVALGLFWVPTLLMPGAWAMIYQSPQMQRLWDFEMVLGPERSLFIVPVLFAGLLYAAWEIGRMNLAVIWAFLGMAFFTLVLFCQAPVGWTLWVVPFLTLYQLKADAIKQLIIAGFSILFVLSYTGQASGADWVGGMLPSISYHWPVLHSCLVAAGLLIAVNMVQNAFRHNQFNQLTRSPISIGIAGDSCTGKDTLSLALTGLFGQHRVAALSGDDYHRYERHHGLWDVMTHLNPKANYLYDFAKDATALLAGQTVFCQEYDHQTGRFHPSRAKSSADVLLFSGLHALVDEPVRSALTVKVFLSMAPDLRHHLKLKRDVSERGYSPDKVIESIGARTEDYERYIAPQAQYANIHFHLSSPDIKKAPNNMVLKAIFSGRFDVEALARALMVCAGVPSQVQSDKNTQTLTVASENLSADTIAQLAHRLVPQLEELLSTEPQWESNLVGLMQVVILMQLGTQAKGGQVYET